MFRNNIAKALFAVALIVTLLVPTAFTVQANIPSLPAREYDVAHGTTRTFTVEVGGSVQPLSWDLVNPAAWPASIFPTIAPADRSFTFTHNAVLTAPLTVSVRANLGSPAFASLPFYFTLMPETGGGNTGPNDTPVGETFTDSADVVWRVLDNTRHPGFTLIMTEYVHGGFQQHTNAAMTPYNTTNVYTRFPSSALRGHITRWANGTIPHSPFYLSSEIADIARMPMGLTQDVRDAADGTVTQAQIRVENGALGRSAPGAAATNGADALFILSVSEVNQYLPTDAGRLAACANGTATSRAWWTRSPGWASHAPVALMSAFVSGVSATDADSIAFGFRPAVWVSNDTPAIIWGDVNGDGVVDEQDVYLLNLHVLGHPVTINLDVADVTQDGNIDGLDVLLLNRYVAGHDVVLGPR